MIDAAVLLGFGGPTAPQEIRPFLDRVLRGRPVPASRYEAVVDHYMAIGGRSPYNELTYRQANALAEELRARGRPVPVHVGFRNMPPSIADTFSSLQHNGARSVFAIPLAAYGGISSADRYVAEAEQAVRAFGGALHVEYAAPYFDHPLFIQAHVSRIREALPATPGTSELALIFTAHSVPRTASLPYARQLEYAASRIAEQVGVTSWRLAYQSRSGSPAEPWLEPDVRDVLRAVAQRGGRDAILAPIGFTCEHLEVLYDLDVEAAAVARECGIAMTRARALDDHPLFVAMLADLVECTS